MEKINTLFECYTGKSMQRVLYTVFYSTNEYINFGLCICHLVYTYTDSFVQHVVITTHKIRLKLAGKFTKSNYGRMYVYKYYRLL